MPMPVELKTLKSPAELTKIPVTGTRVREDNAISQNALFALVAQDCEIGSTEEFALKYGR